MAPDKLLRNQAGFTLIEIIAVIIIMGILSAVAVPKFFSMQEDAKKATLSGGISEAATRFNHAYARFILDHKRAPAGIAEMHTADYLGADSGTIGNGESIGDFAITWRPHGSEANAIIIYIESCNTIPDLTGMDQFRQKTVRGISWSSS